MLSILSQYLATQGNAMCIGGGTTFGEIHLSHSIFQSEVMNLYVPLSLHKMTMAFEVDLLCNVCKQYRNLA